MGKRYFALFIVVVLMFSLVACGGDNDQVEENEEVEAGEEVDEKAEEVEESEEDPEIDIENSGLLIDGELGEKDDRGTGPVKIESRLGVINIPEGLDYKIYHVPTEGKGTSIQVNFGIGNVNSGLIEITTTRMIESLDDAANECIRTNDFGTMDSEIGEEVTFGDHTFKAVKIYKPDNSRITNFLVTHYKTDSDDDGYVEIAGNEEDGAYNIDINDPLIKEMLDSLELK